MGTAAGGSRGLGFCRTVAADAGSPRKAVAKPAPGDNAIVDSQVSHRARAAQNQKEIIYSPSKYYLA